MGQSVSSGNIPSIFNWSSDSPRSVSSSSNEYRDCRNGNSVDEETEDRQLRKNFNSFSCFHSYDTADDTVQVKIIETQPRNADKNEDMPSSKKCYSFCNNGDNVENSEHNSADNPSLCHQNMQSSRNDASEINGNQTSPIQSCSFINSDLQKRGGTSTSINRYVTAFTEMSLDDESKDNNGFRNVAGKSNDSKRTPKQKKNNFRECNGCSKEPKNNNKVGAKKKNTWLRFSGSKSSKSNNSKLLNNPSSSSTPDADSACVCTSYKKVEDKQENEPNTVDSNNFHLWKPDGTNGNQSTSNWSLVTGTSNMLYNIPNRGNECISCEGSHCHLEWNAIADLSNIRLPINITVTRVGSSAGSQNPGSGENNLILLSLGSQRPFDARMRSDEYQIEDCDMRARLRRAFEIDEGIEIPSSVFNSPQFQVVSPEELRALLFQQQIPASATFIDRATPQHGRIHTQVDYIHCLVPDLRSITGCSFYWGKMDRYEAERLLDGKPEGTFLLRDSAQEEYLFSVSFRKYQRSLHARIEQFNHKFSFDSHDPAVFASETVTGLIEHYKDPTCVMFFEPMLTTPLSRTFTFPLQHLCRAVIVSCTTYDGINELRLPQGIKAYLKEYHYRQRVRVKRFDVSPESSEESQ